MSGLCLVHGGVSNHVSVEGITGRVGCFRELITRFSAEELERYCRRLAALDAVLVKHTLTLEGGDVLCIKEEPLPSSALRLFRKWTRSPTRIAQLGVETGLILSRGAGVYFLLRSGESAYLKMTIGYEAPQDAWSYQLETVFDKRHESGFSSMLRREGVPYGRQVISSDRADVLFSRILCQI